MNEPATLTVALGKLLADYAASVTAAAVPVKACAKARTEARAYLADAYTDSTSAPEATIATYTAALAASHAADAAYTKALAAAQAALPALAARYADGLAALTTDATLSKTP